MKRFLYALAILAILAVIAVVALPFVLSPAFIADQLAQSVHQATGRTLVMGDSPRLSLWPEIAVDIDNVVLSNPPGMFEGRFVSVDRMKLKIGIAPLFEHRLEIRELTLVRPRVGLVVDGQGKANWRFDAGSDKVKSDNGSEAGAMPDIALAPIYIQDGDIRYLDERSGTALAIEHADLTITAPKLDGPIDLKGHATWKNQRVQLDFFVKAPRRLVGEGSPIDLAVNGALVNVSFDGLARLNAGFDLAGTVEMDAPSLRDMAEWLGKPLPPGAGLKAFSAKGGLELTDQAVILKKASIGLDGMNARGDMSIDLSGDRPDIAASLGIDHIDIDAYLGPQPKAPADAKGIYAWSGAPIDVSSLTALDARLALAANEISYRDVKTGKARINATLKGGKLIANLSDMTFYNGKASGEVVLSASKGAAVVQGRLTAEGVDGYRLLNDFAGFKRIAGTGTLSVSVAARGKSQRELVSTLNGAAAMRLTNGAVRGIDIPAMMHAVGSGILSGWGQPNAKDTEFTRLDATYTISDGVATSNDLKLIGPLVMVTAAGSADLLERRLDFKVEPKLVAALKGDGSTDAAVTLPVPLVVSGPWDDPKIYPDIKGLLKDPKAGYDSLRKMIQLGQTVDLKTEATKAGDKANQLLNGLLNGNKPATDATGKQTTP